MPARTIAHTSPNRFEIIDASKRVAYDFKRSRLVDSFWTIEVLSHGEVYLSINMGYVGKDAQGGVSARSGDETVAESIYQEAARVLFEGETTDTVRRVAEMCLKDARAGTELRKRLEELSAALTQTN